MSTPADLLHLSFSVDAVKLGIAAQFVLPSGKDHPRFGEALRSVLIEPHPTAGVIIVASNAATMVVQFDGLGHASMPFCIQLTDDQVAQFPGDGKRRRTLSLRSLDPAFTLKTEGQRSTEFVSDRITPGSAYPNWRSVVPDWDSLTPCVPAILNAIDLGKLTGMTLTGIDRRTSAGHSFYMYASRKSLVAGNADYGRPAIVTFERTSEMFAILMPMDAGKPDVAERIRECKLEPEWLSSDFDVAGDL